MAEWKLEWSRPHVRCVLRMMVCLLLVMVPVIEGNSTATGMDLTTASPQDTAPGVTPSQASSATDCFLSIPFDEKENVDDIIKEVFQDNAVFIYFKLNFSNPQDIYENSSNVIDPSTWVWAVEGKGELLLSYPFDFEQLSLGTLTLGVVTVEVSVSTPSDDCFQEATDDNKQRIIARFVGSLVQSANDTLNITNNEFYENKGSMVCLEKQRSDDFKLIGVYGIPLCTYYVLQGSTLYECWAGDQNPFETESTLVRKHGWLGAILALGYILAIFSPLAASFFIRKQEPIKKDGREYIALNADLPLGLKYLLCFSFQDYPALVAFRWVVCVVAFMFIQFIPYIVSYVMRGDAFIHRLDVAYELLFSENFLSKGVVIIYYIFFNILFLTIAMLFHRLYLYDDSFIVDNLEVKPTDPIVYRFGLELPENPSPSNSALRTFMYTVWYKTQMAINPAFWSFWFSGIWKLIYGLLEGLEDEANKNRCRLLVTFIVFFIVSPLALLLFCCILWSNSLPLIYIPGWTISKYFSLKGVKNFLASLCGAFVSIPVIFVFVAAFIYIAELIGYTFIGFVLNTDFASPLAFVIVTVVGYLITASTGFYDKYYVLLKRTIATAEQLDKEVEMVPTAADGDHYNDESATDQESSPLNNRGVENQTTQPNRQMLVEFEKGIPFIPLHLFKLVISKYQPIYLEVATILFWLLVTGIVVAFGLATIISIDSVSDLPAIVKFFAMVVVAGIVPLLMLILKSPGERENDDELKARYLKAVVKQYAELANQPTERTPGDETFVAILNSAFADSEV